MKKISHFVLILFLLPVLPVSAAYAQGNINGLARLSLKDGNIACADWVRVLLVRSEAEVPECPDLNHMGKFERMETLRNLHMIFFVNVREKMSDPDYVVRSTLTTPDGTFQFSDISPGAYYILVTFPAMIRDYKVAWQIPVAVKDNETVRIELNNENLVIPTYSRHQD
jgi:hypothetical protein